MSFDLDTLLALMVASWAIAMLVQARRRRQHGWTTIAGLLVALLALGFTAFPAVVGHVAGAIWLLAGVFPMLGARLGARLLARERYAQAERAYRIASLLHPLDGWPLQAQIVGSIRRAAAGDLRPVDELLDELRAMRGEAALLGIAQLLRIKRDPQEILRLWQDRGLDQQPERQPSISSLAIWALAEIGQLEAAFAVYRTLRTRLPALQHRAAPLGCELVLASHAGRLDLVQALLKGPFATMPEASRRYCLLATRLARGEPSAREGLEQLGQQVSARNALLARAVAERLALPELRQVQPEDHHLLDGIARELEIRQRYGQGASRGTRPYATLAIAGLIALVFAAEIVLGGPTNPRILWSLGALHPSAVAYGEWWRVFTSTFLHYGWLHVLLNTVALLFFGPYVEFSLGRIAFIWCYLVSGVGSMSALVLATRAGFMEPAPIVGASGGIMGLVGATAAILLLGWWRERASIAKRRLAGIGGIIALQMVIDYLIPQVSGLAHSSGALLGFLNALALASRRNRR